MEITSENKANSKNCRPVKNSSNFLNVVEYILLPHLEKHLPVDQIVFAFWTGTGCIDAIRVLKETVMYYNL